MPPLPDKDSLSTMASHETSACLSLLGRSLRDLLRSLRPLGRVGEEAAFTERDIEALLTLVRCPRTEKTPNGLLVAKAAARFFVADTDANPGAPAAPVKE